MGLISKINSKFAIGNKKNRFTNMHVEVTRECEFSFLAKFWYAWELWAEWNDWFLNILIISV